MQRNDFDLLLTWASYKGSGHWQQWRTACLNWKQAQIGAQSDKTNLAWQAFSALGHIDFEPGFRHGVRWQAAPAAFAILPDQKDKPLQAVLCGQRCEDLLQKLENDLGTDRIKMLPQNRGPLCVQVSVENEKDLEKLCSHFQIANAGVAAQRLLQALPMLEAWLPLAPTASQPDISPFESFDVETGEWEKDNLGLIKNDGALMRKRTPYEFNQYFFKHNGAWLRIPWQFGFCLASRACTKPLVFYNAKTRELSLRQRWMQLPALYLRCLTLCSGVLPNYDKRKGSRIFENVPLTIAYGIVQRLQQRLEIINE